MVLRLGRMVGTTHPAETDEHALAALMVGHEVQLELDKEPAAPQDTVLDIHDLRVLDDRHGLAVDGLSLQVRAGEIVGVAGVQGNGQTELVETLTGLRAMNDGRVSIAGKDISHASPRQVTELGVAHVPEDRQRDGLVLDFPVADNLMLNTYYLPPNARGITLQDRVIRENAVRRVAEFDIRTPGIDAPVANLSGGNQQKVIVAREFSRPIKLLIASQPTRGLDVGSVEYIHKRILAARDAGTAILLVSSELDEIVALSDRIAVMYKGRLTGVVKPDEVTRQQLGLLMAGYTEDERASSPDER